MNAFGSFSTQIQVTGYIITRHSRTNGAFRLVDLAGGTDADDIVLTLSNNSIDEPPSYEALSYTWGEKVTIKYIRCNDFDLAVTSSLIEALTQFRFKHGKRTLWVDQCCIDQSNVDERSDQVNLMRVIYRSAVKVLSWLGPAAAPDGLMPESLLRRINGAIDSTAALGQEAMSRGVAMGGFLVDETVAGSKQNYATRNDRYFYPSDEWLTGHGLPIVTAPEWTAFETFMNNGYFQRMWIIQEIQVSTTATLQWGKAEIPWVDVHNAVRFCVMNGLMERPGFEPTGWMRYLSPFATNGKSSLTSFLTLTKAHKCTDAPDRIFALIGVSWGITDSADSGEVNLEADYPSHGPRSFATV